VQAKTVAAVLVLSLVMCGVSVAEDRAIGGLFAGKKPIKVFVESVKNETGKGEVAPEVFRKSLESCFAGRKSTSFEVVSAPADSDIKIDAVIKNFQYLVRGPMKPGPGAQMMLIDAAATATSNYVEIGVEFTVISTKTGEVLWKSGLADYLKRVMTPEESMPMIYDKISRIFLWKCFGKQRGTAVSSK
jgi:hypothetical protein